jgi:hypothetical protein
VFLLTWLERDKKFNQLSKSTFHPKMKVFLQQISPFLSTLGHTLDQTVVLKVSQKVGLSSVTVAAIVYTLMSISLFFEIGHAWVIQLLLFAPIVQLDLSNVNQTKKNLLFYIVALGIQTIELTAIQLWIPFYYVFKASGLVYLCMNGEEVLKGLEVLLTPLKEW